MSKTLNELTHSHAKLVSHSFWRRTWKVGLDSIRSFIEDDCYTKASVLTFYSLLSVVPVLAVLFGIAKGFGFEKALEFEIGEHFAEQRELIEKLIQFAYSWLKTVQGGLIAGIGTVVLFWSVFGLLNSIETTLNSIWKVRTARPYNRKISDYLATMVICPLFFVTSSSMTLYLSTQLTQTAHSNIVIEAVSPLLVFILKLFPFFLSWILFTFVYLFMPNTKVFIRSALIAGILAGTTFQLWQWVYFRFQIGVSSYGAIYGSFAALPLFLVWLQISWLILLAGAEIAFELENDLFIPSRTSTPLSHKAAALLITYRCTEAFAKGNAPLTDRNLAHELGMSLNHLHTLLEALQSENILVAITNKDQIIGYQPAKAIEFITFAKVCQAIDKSNELVVSVKDSIPLSKIQNLLEQVDFALETSVQNQPLYPTLSN